MGHHGADVGQRGTRPGGQREGHLQEHLAGDHQRLALGQAVHRGGHPALDRGLERDPRGGGGTRPDGGESRGDTRLGVPGSLRGGNGTAEGGLGEGTLGPEIGEPRRRRSRHPARVVRAGPGEVPARGKLPRCEHARSAREGPVVVWRKCVTPGSARVTHGDLQAALWRLLAASDSEDATAFLALLDGSRDAFDATDDPCWVTWRHALEARRALIDEDADGAATAVGAARETLDKCPPDADTALTIAYLAHVEVAADRVDAAMLLAVDASLLTEQLSAGEPSKALHQAHRWLSLTLSSLDLEE